MPEGDVMATDSTQPALNHVPWQLVPVFDLATSNYNDYKAKIQLLLMTWPAKFKKELAVRMAIQMTGTAWDKLKTMMDKISAEDCSGVQAILSSLERWADGYENSLFAPTRRAEESLQSFCNHVDAAFLKITNLKIENIHAYILMMQSGLPVEDRKKIVILANNDMVPKKIEDAMNTMGSEFLNPNPCQSKGNAYPIMMADGNADQHDGGAGGGGGDGGGVDDINDDDFIFMMAEADDDYALVVVEFELQLLEAIKQHPELSCAYSNYVESRKKVLMKKTHRGFWRVKNKFSGSKGTEGFQRPQSRRMHLHVQVCDMRAERSLEK
jgi:hypothetical protein